MTWYAHVQTDISVGQDGVAIQLIEYGGRGTVAMAVQPITLDLAEKPEGNIAPVALHLEGELGRALYEALARHYSGTAVVQTQREDYLHERGRVDRLIATVSQLATAGYPTPLIALATEEGHRR